MNNTERIKQLKEKEYQELFGVKKATFEKMLEILNEQYKKDHEKGGKPPKLSVLDKLIIMLCYYREYRTMQHIAFDYSVSKSTICESIQWVEQTLVKSGVFRLPSKKELHSNASIEVILIDATEVEIERPKKNKNNITPERRKSTH
ncbi:MAG: transposase family protein [Clostridia bacterium]|nr:transposase family protein [Clostridia bacterium]